MAAVPVQYADAVPLCAIAKTASPSVWHSGTKAGSLKNSFGVVCDPPRRGLLVEIHINGGHKVKRRTVNFGLWDTSSGSMERAYQLTLADSASPTHREKGVAWYGSHEHIGDRPTKLSELNAVPFLEALKRFCASINLKLDEELSDPLVLDLN